MNKKLMSLWQMFNLNFGFFGIQVGWSLQMANMSGIYKFLGADVSHMGYLWLAAPLSGLIVQPILGQVSDQTWTRIGRRRPYILGGAIVSTLALILMPNAGAVWFAATLLWLLDGSINVAMQPYRALVADVAPDEQHTKCYSVQTALVGLGATIAYILPWVLLHIFNVQSADTGIGVVPLSLRLSFYIGAAMFLLPNIYTVFFSSEYPPENLAEWEKNKQQFSFWKTFTANSKSIIIDFIHMPKVMREVSVVQFFSWSGMFCVFLYYGIGVAQNIFGLPTGAQVEANPTYHNMLEQGIALGGICAAVYNLVSIFYVMIIPKLSGIITRRAVHAISLFLGAVGLIASNYVTSKVGLFICMIGLGAAWASIVTIPYAILAKALPKEKMGLYMGLLNMTICIPEIIAALTLGAVAKVFFAEHAMSIVALGGFFMLIAAASTFLVHDTSK